MVPNKSTARTNAEILFMAITPFYVFCE